MKRSSNRLVLLVGLFLAVVAFVLIAILFQNNQTVGQNNGPSAAPTTANVVVATREIALGSKITADAVKTKAVAVADKPADSYGDVSQVIGLTIRQPVIADQLITSAIINGSTSVTDIAVPAGYVAISVQVDQITGVGTVIKAGDHVDVVTGFTAFPVTLYSQTPVITPRPSTKPGTSPSPSGSASASQPANVSIGNVDAQYDQNSVKTVVEGLQVLGTLLPPTAQDTTASAKPGTTLNGQMEIVILAATPQQAEAIRFAQVKADGTIALVLRSSADCQATDGTASACPIIPTTGITLRMMVDSYGVLPPQVIQVLMPTPYPSPFPSRLYPSPSPDLSGSAAPSGSTAP